MRQRDDRCANLAHLVNRRRCVASFLDSFNIHQFITDWCDDYLACRLCNIYLRLTSKAHYKTYRQAECASLLREAGHAEATVERYKISWLWGLMTARAQKPVGV